MELGELKAACIDAIARWENGTLISDYPSIPLVVNHIGQGENIRLCGKYGPLSEIIANQVEGRGTVAYWDARKVLKFLERVKP
jgi:hypothetical protein